MLSRQKEVLNAQFARNNLEIHKKVVDLYLLNLVTVVVFALIAMSHFVNGTRRVGDFVLNHPIAAYPYLMTAILGIYSSLVTSLLAVTMYTYGNAMFLQTEDHKKVVSVVRKMKLMQEQAGKWGLLVLFFIIMQKWIPIWGTGVPYIFIAGQSTIFLAGFYMIFTHARKAVDLFSEHNRGALYS